MEIVTHSIFLGSKITADSNWSHEIKRQLLLGWKAITNLDSVLKSRDITDKGPHSQSHGFSSSRVCMWELNIKKAEHKRTDAFELWCWRRLLRIPWTARSNQSILKEINPEYSLEGLMLKLKLHYFGHLMWRTDSLEKTLRLGKIEGRRRRGQQEMRWLDGITDWMDINLSKLQETVRYRRPACCSPWGCRVGYVLATEQQQQAWYKNPTRLQGDKKVGVRTRWDCVHSRGT